jgi:hypothetical protein
MTEVLEDTITEITRRAVLDIISGMWSGRLSDIEFLERLYDLDELPSKDMRFRTASTDIWQHRVNNPNDWEDDWVFQDWRFRIFGGTDEEFLRFVAETVHPMVRPDQDEASALVSSINELLEIDGWHLTPVRYMSGRPIYGAGQPRGREGAFEEPTGWVKVDRQLQSARVALREANIEEEFQTVGLLCREALISAAQAAYDRAKYPPTDGIEPSDTDANRMIEALLAVELAGGANEEARSHAKASLKLAVAVQHRRRADYRTAALCIEATFSVINILTIVTGQRDRSGVSSASSRYTKGVV